MPTKERQRRSRNHATPSGKQVKIEENDIRGIFEPLSRYDQLPTDRLELLDPRANTKKRLTDFFQELQGKDRYIERFPLTGLGRKWYRLAERGKRAVVASGLLPADKTHWIAATRIGRRSFNEHTKMICLVMADIEIAAKAAGIRYISHMEILSRAAQDAQRGERPLAIPIRLDWAGQDRTSVEPDGFFGLQYQDGSYSFFALEADNDSEPYEPTDRTRSGIERKIRSYLSAMDKRDGPPAYKTHLGVSSFNVLFVGRHERIKAIRQLAKKLNANDRFYFKALPYQTVFDEYYPYTPDIFHGEWQTPSGTAFIDRP